MRLSFATRLLLKIIVTTRSMFRVHLCLQQEIVYQYVVLHCAVVYLYSVCSVTQDCTSPCLHICSSSIMRHLAQKSPNAQQLFCLIEQCMMLSTAKLILATLPARQRSDINIAGRCDPGQTIHAERDNHNKDLYSPRQCGSKMRCSIEQAYGRR